MLWNKTLLHWEEPCFAKKFIAKHLRFTDYLSAFGRVAVKLAVGTYIVFWLLRWISPRGSTSFIDLEIFGVVSLIVGGYFLLWLISLLGSKFSRPQVYLRKKHLAYISVEGNLAISYKQMESFGIVKAKLEENEYSVLQIRDWDGNESFIEIDPQINDDSISEILKSKNVQQKKSLIYSS